MSEPDEAERGSGRGIVEVVRDVGAHPGAPLASLVLAVGLWVVMMGRLILLRQHRIATFDFDEGIYDQYLWQLAHFRAFNTVRGVPIAGHHASFAFLLMVPLVWLGGGVGTWDILHTLALGCTAFPLFFLARDRLKRPWIAFAVGVVWLAQPTVQWLVHEGFHPEGMAIPFLVGTYLYGERYRAERALGEVTRHTRWGFWLCFFGAITWKEDLALALVGMGLVWLIRREWKLARNVMVIAAVWFVVFGMILVPHFAGGSVYGGIYDLGSTPSQIISNSVQHPSRVMHKLSENDAVGYTRTSSQSYGFVPFASPVTLLIGLPQWTTNIISASSFTWSPEFHYQDIPMAAMALGMVDGLAWILRKRRWLGEAAALMVLVSALLCTRWYGPSPLSVKYHDGIWPLQPAADLPVREEAKHMIPSSAGVAADYLMVPQLTHRQIIYTFPNPWLRSNYGVKPTAHGNPAKVQWILVDESVLGQPELALLSSIEASGEFRTVLNSEGVVVMRRIEPPGHGTRRIVVPPAP